MLPRDVTIFESHASSLYELQSTVVIIYLTFGETKLIGF